MLVDKKVLELALKALEQRDNATLWHQALHAIRDALAYPEEQPKESLPDSCEISLKMQCLRCNHIQIAKGNRHDGHNYFGSSYNWCDECEHGIPTPIESVKERKPDNPT
jgi:hypothetical protein